MRLLTQQAIPRKKLLFRMGAGLVRGARANYILMSIDAWKAKYNGEVEGGNQVFVQLPLDAGGVFVSADGCMLWELQRVRGGMHYMRKLWSVG